MICFSFFAELADAGVFVFWERDCEGAHGLNVVWCHDSGFEEVQIAAFHIARVDQTLRPAVSLTPQDRSSAHAATSPGL